MKLAHYHRYPFYDYSRGASLFVSLSTEPRRRLFGEVGAGGEMKLSPFGVEVLGAIEFTFAKAEGFTLYGRCVLPDHCHFRIYLAPGVGNARAAALINTVVGRFKSYTTHLYQKKYGGQGALWLGGARRVLAGRCSGSVLRGWPSVASRLSLTRSAAVGALLTI